MNLKGHRITIDKCYELGSSIDFLDLLQKSCTGLSHQLLQLMYLSCHRFLAAFR